MIKLRVTVMEGLVAKDVFIFLSKNHPFVVTTSEDHGEVYTRINDGIHRNGGWRVVECIEAVLSQIEDQL